MQSVSEAPLPVLPFQLTRIQRPYPSGGYVLQDSTAVITNGSPDTARVATLGINPSNGAFDHGGLRRLSSFGLTSPADLSDDQAREVAHSCYTYFSNSSNPHAWFTAMDTCALTPIGVSYFDGTACHLNLTPWATDPVWSKLAPTVRQTLLDADRSFLLEQLTHHAFDVVVINGAQVLAMFEREFTELSVAGEIPRGAGGRYVVKTGRWADTTVIGWSLNVPNSFTSAASRAALTALLQSGQLNVGP